MAKRIEKGDTLAKLAQDLLGDARLTNELHVPGWRQGLPLPVGGTVYLRGEPQGPPSRNWSKPQE